MNDFMQEALRFFDYTQSMRRDFHMHPELGFNEIRTGGIVARELESLGLEVTKGVGRTGVVGLLEGARPGPTLLLRFDMDALPILEQTAAEYASTNPGVMHACGHDGHTAIGLTVARMLHELRHELAGTVKFVFQPSEESTGDEGLGGAEMMIRDGVLSDPKPDYALGLHLWNEQPLGWLGVAAGPVMAGCEQFKVTIQGKGGHGAVPHATRDPMLAAAHVITALQSIVSRNVAPLETAVVSVTSVHGGTAFNVIPQDVTLEGTIRTFDLGVRGRVLERFGDIVDGVAGEAVLRPPDAPARGCDVDRAVAAPAGGIKFISGELGQRAPHHLLMSLGHLAHQRRELRPEGQDHAPDRQRPRRRLRAGRKRALGADGGRQGTRAHHAAAQP